MTRTTTRRALPKLIVLLVASAFAITLVGQSPADRAAATQRHAGAPVAAVDSAKARALHDTMRKLWEDHITWTRLAIVSFAADLPDLPQTEARLLRNQADIGAAITPYYGRRAGDRLSALLREHITGAVALLVAARAGDSSQVAVARTAWYANANQVADLLHRANPRQWGRGELRTMMREHLDETLDEAVAHLQGRYGDDIRAYERVHRHILRMADMLSTGIIRQFPRRFIR